MYNQLNLSQMGCFDTSLYHQDKNVHEIYVILSKSDVEMMEEFSDVRNQKNYDLLKRIAEENEIVSQRLKQKIDELCLKRNKGDPLQIAVGKCGNPCYAYQLNLFFNCPKCNGNIKRNMENGYTTERIYDDYSQSFRDAKNYNESNICKKFDFNENIDKCDVDSDECIKYFEKIDEQKTVHWSFDIQKNENNNWVTKEIEKDVLDLNLMRILINVMSILMNFLNFMRKLMSTKQSIGHVMLARQTKQILFLLMCQKKKICLFII